MDLEATALVPAGIGLVCKLLTDILKGGLRDDLPRRQIILPSAAFLMGFGLSVLWALRERMVFDGAGVGTVAYWGLGAGAIAILATEVHKKVRPEREGK